MIFWAFKQAGPNTVSYREGWNLPQAGLNLLALVILMQQEHHPYAKGLGSLNKLAGSLSMSEGGGLLIY